MARKRNQELRPIIDGRKRKRINDGLEWERRLMDELKNDEYDEKPNEKRKGRRESASRLTNTSL